VAGTWAVNVTVALSPSTEVTRSVISPGPVATVPAASVRVISTSAMSWPSEGSSSRSAVTVKVSGPVALVTLVRDTSWPPE
jgi:hypothetical protein